MSKEKIGAGHAQAWFRAGFKESAQLLNAFPDATIRPMEEPGLFGNLTPQEIVEAKEKYSARIESHGDRGESAAESPGMEQ